MNTATADGSRALYGISKDGMTVKELGRLNRFNVPGNAMSLDMVINILFVLFVGNIFGILAASNIGYVLANVFAIVGVRPAAEGPAELATADQAARLLDADRRRALRRLRRLHRRRHRLVPDRRRAVYGKGTKEKIIGFAVLGGVAAPLPVTGGSSRTARRRTGVRRRRRCRRTRRPTRPPALRSPEQTRGATQDARQARRLRPARLAANSQNLAHDELPPRSSTSRAQHRRCTGPPEGIESAVRRRPRAGAARERRRAGPDPSVEFRRTLGMFATGVTVITTLAGEQVHGMTANAFMSVSLQPPLILISVDRRAKMNALLREGARYGVSVLEERQTRALRPLRRPRRARTRRSRASRSSTTRRSSRARSRISSRGSCAPTGAATTRSSSARSSTSRYGEGTPLLFHGGRYERVVRDPRVFSELPRGAARPLLASGRRARRSRTASR